MIPSAPKFKKVELLLKLGGTKNYDENDSLRDLDIQKTTKVTHDDCAMIITGNYVIITEDQGNNDIDVENNIKGKIYTLSEIDSYRLYND